MSEFLPPVVVKLEGDISDFVEKFALADGLLKEFAHHVPDDFEDVAPAFEKEGDKAGRAFAGALRDARGRFIAAGEESSDHFQSGFHRTLTKVSNSIDDAFRDLPKVLGSIGSGAANAFSATFLPAMVTAGVGAASQIIGALAPAVGVLGLIPAAALTAATALGTLMLALKGVGGALSSGLSGDTAAFTKALQGLTPSAQAAVKALVTLKPQLDAIKKTVQENFFTGLAADLKKIGQEYLPVLRTELGNAANGFNQMARSILGMVNTPDFLKSVQTTMHNVGIAVTGVANAFPALLSGFNDLAEVGSGFLPQFAAWIVKISDSFSKFIARVADGGQLHDFIQGGIDAFKLLWGLLSSVGAVLGDLLRAMQAVGTQGLGAIGRLVQVMADFLGSAEGMKILTALFGILGQLVDALGGALGQLLVAIGPLLSTLLTGLGPIITLLTGQLLPVITQLATSLSTALVPVIAALAPVLSSVLTALMPLIAALGGALGQTLIALAPVIAEIVTLMGKQLVTVLDALVPQLIRLLPPFVQMAQQLLPELIPLLIALAEQSAAMLPALIPLIKVAVDLAIPLMKLATIILGFLIPAFTSMISSLTPAINAVSKFFGWLIKGADSASTWKAVGKFFVGLWHDITGAFSSGVAWVEHQWDRLLAGAGKVIAWFQALPGRIGAALAALPGVIASTAVRAFDLFFFSVGYAIGSVIKFFMDLPGRVMAALHVLAAVVGAGVMAVVWFFTQLPIKIAAIINDMWSWLVGKFTSGRDQITHAVSSLPTQIAGIFSNVWEHARILTAAGVQAVVSFFQGLPGRAASALSALRGAVTGALAGAGSWLISAGEALIRGLANGITGAMGAAIDAAKRAMHAVVAGAKAALGIQSPSTVFAEIGQHTVGGFVQGIDDHGGTAAAAVARMLAAAGSDLVLGVTGGGGLAAGPGMAGPTWGPAPRPAPGGGAGGGRQVIEAHIYMDGKQIHQQLMQVSQRYRLRTGTTGLETPRTA